MFIILMLITAILACIPAGIRSLFFYDDFVECWAKSCFWVFASLCLLGAAFGA